MSAWRYLLYSDNEDEMWSKRLNKLLGSVVLKDQFSCTKSSPTSIQGHGLESGLNR